VRFFVPGQRKRRRLVSLQRVAALAGVEVRRPSELSIVLVLVAIGAVRKLDLEERVLAFGNMTLGTFDREVFPFERISGSGMIFCRKGRRLKTIHGVAGRAFRPLGPLHELPIMWIGLVAIHALRERDRLFEISTSVAERAIHRRMLALQRVLGLRVIEVPTHRSQRNSFPAFGAVAGLAALRETAVVRIGVTIRALGKRYPGVARLAVGARCVALFTLHLDVRSGQRIACLGVIKLANVDRLPVGVVVALDTIRTESPFVRILVAGGAGLRNAQKAARKVLHLDRRALRWDNMIGAMAASTSHAGMLAFENITGKFVIEGFGIPLDERKILTVVFRVTARALLA